MSHYASQYRVEPGKALHLSKIDADFKPKNLDKAQGNEQLRNHIRKMSGLQNMLYAEGKRSLLVVFQGLDASGKGGTIRKVFSGINPAGCRVTSFKQPTPEELEHDFLWRCHRYAPRKGMIAVFNRSHYEDVLIVRVHNLAPKRIWSQRFEMINNFEQMLAVDNNTTILKFYLHISKDEQLRRFGKRLDNPAKNWKISDADYKERAFWDEYVEAFEDMMPRTSTEHAPWYVIPANHKWYRNLVISQIIADALDGMDMRMPAPTVDMGQIRREYHQAKMDGGKS